MKHLLIKTARKTGIDADALLELIAYVKDRPGHDRRYAIDPSKMAREFNWGPETEFGEGLSRTVDWYLSHKDWWKHILSGAYLDYYKIQYGESLS